MIPSNLRPLCAVMTLAFLPGIASAQFGGGGLGPLGGGMMQGQEPPELSERMVEVESSTGKRVSGPLRLGPIAIDSDFGRYAIPPEKLSTIRFDIPEGHPRPMMNTIVMGGVQGFTVPGTVVAASGEELAGSLNLYGPLKMTTNLGPLALDPYKLRSITFLPDDPEGENAGDDAEDDVEDAEPEPPSATDAQSSVRRNAPEPMNFNDFLWAVAPLGDRVAVRHTQSGKTARLDLPASEDSPLFIVPITHANLAALHLEGQEIRRVAVLNTTNRRWYPLDLCEPVSGKATPLIMSGTAVYHLGRFVHAFSTQSNCWATLELPEGASATPVVNVDTVTVQEGNRIHTFRADTGAWTTVDTQELLNDLLEDEDAAGDPPSPKAEDATEPTP